MVFESLLAVLDPVTFLIMLAGLFVGIIFGMIPGLTGITAIAILTPFTYGMAAIPSLILMSSIYCGAVYAGSISAVLFNCPGDLPAIMTAVDGYPMRQQGEAGRALVASMVSSGVGGIIGVIIAWIGAMSLIRIVLKFGPPEYFALAVMGLALVASIGAKNVFKSLVSAVLGLFLCTLGTDPLTGVGRFTFDIVALNSGVSFVPAIIGLYAVGETLIQFTTLRERREMERLSKTETLPKLTFLSKHDFTLSWPHWIRNSFLGCAIGILPGAGSTIAACVGYGLARLLGKEKEKFGHGAYEGVVGPETANNAAVGGAMVPLVTMGIPGSACAALILNVFLMHGLQPGPDLFTNQPQYVHPIFISMLLTNILIIFVPMLMVRYIVKVLQVPYEYMGAAIIFVAMVGAFSLNNRMLDVWITAIFGVMGFLLVRYEYSMSALTLGLVLGPMMERGLRHSLLMFGGDTSKILDRPVAMTLLTVAAIVLIVPYMTMMYGWYAARCKKGAGVM